MNIPTPARASGVLSVLACCCALCLSCGGVRQMAGGSPELTKIVVTPAAQSIAAGASLQFTATGAFSDGTQQDLTSWVAWQASPATIAKIDTQGGLTGVAEGAAQVSANYRNMTGTASVSVSAAALLRIAVSANRLSLPLGESEPLTASGSFSDGTIEDLSSVVTWNASPSGIIKISAEGNLTALSQGPAHVSAAYEGVAGDASITVTAPALLHIVVSPNQPSLPLGESLPLRATGTFSDGATKNLTQSAAWSSSQLGVASVTAGAVVAKGVGAATIRATVGKITGASSLSVTAAVAVALNITPVTLSLLIGNSSQLQAVATLSDGTTQDLTASAHWSSATPSIVYVNSAGVATGAQVGSGTILARATTTTAATGSLTASAALNVTPLMTVSYFNRVNAVSSGADGWVQLVNPGITTGPTDGNLCAMIYVFDRNQELNECCGCSVSDSGLRTLSLIEDLTSNPLTGKPPVAGTIEIVPSQPGNNGQCNAGSLTPNGMLVGWETNPQGATRSSPITEMPLLLVPLGNTQAKVLANECRMMQQLGGGAGICSCGTGE